MDVPDDFIPGIPGLEGGTDQITAMIETVVRVPDAGFYTFGFNSDDGFLTTAGNDKADAVKLGEFSGGREPRLLLHSLLESCRIMPCRACGMKVAVVRTWSGSPLSPTRNCQRHCQWWLEDLCNQAQCSCTGDFCESFGRRFRCQPSGRHLSSD